MASFSVNVDYLIISTETAADQVAVTFELTCSDANLVREFTEVYPQSMYYQNIDPEMDEYTQQTQMRGNFLTLAKITIESFASEAKAVIKGDLGSYVDANLTGTIALNSPIVFIGFATKPNSFLVTWN